MKYDLDLVIPAHNRVDRLEKILKYYSRFKLKARVIVADSSEEKIKDQMEFLANKKYYFPVTYISNFPKGTRLFHKMALTNPYLESPYVLVAPDDDFYSVPALDRCVKYLNKHSDYAVCQGKFFSYYWNNTDKKISWHSIYPQMKSITNEDPIQRLDEYLSSYFLSAFSITRTSIFIKSFEFCRKFTDIDDSRFGEILPSLITVLNGKISYQPFFFALREVIPDSWGSISKRIADFKKDGTFDYKYLRFTEAISKEITTLTSLSDKNANKIIAKSFQKYLNNQNRKIINKELIIPNHLKALLHRLHMLEKFKRGSDYKELIKTGVRGYFEFQTINNFITNEYGN